MSARARPGLSAVTSSLSFKLFFVLFLSILLLFAVYAGVRTRFQERQLEQQVKAEAYRASDFIKQSLLTAMLGNERERIYAHIRLLGAEPGVEVVRIYNKKGEIKFSSQEREIGASVDLQAEACYACHAFHRPLQSLPTAERARIYRKELDGQQYRVLGLINPIQNAPGCSNGGCHAHTAHQAGLGVLAVPMSIATLDPALAASERHGFALATLVILAAALLMAAIVFYAVYLPVKQLRRGTEALGRGNLDVEIDLRRSDEMGMLARSFNEMARGLKLVEHHTEIAHVETEPDLRLADDTVVCDREQVVQALIALMINAVEAMPTGGRLTLKTWEGAPGRVCLAVSDTGVGISEEVRERIFDPFFSTKSDAKGVGLGLAVVYGIVQRHEGRISVASTPGAGTTFTIDIPRGPSAAVREGAPAGLAGAPAT